MGCDIHGWVEVKVGDKDIAVKEIKDSSRNYTRFSAMAGVRRRDDGVTLSPLGIPEDVSDTAKYDIDYWGTDGHSHSYMPLKEAADIFLATARNPPAYAKIYPASEFFDFDEDDIDKARLVFWVDN